MVILFLIILVIVIGAKVVYKDNYAVLTGDIQLVQNSDSDLSGTVTINYPEGFNSTNCVPIAIGVTGSLSSSTYKDNYTFGYLDDTSASYVDGAIRRKLTLLSKNMSLKASFMMSGPSSQTRKYKIVLMKIN